MSQKTGDALDALNEQDERVAELVSGWRDSTKALEQADDVEVRWERGSEVKLLLQHLAVRETAIEEIASALREAGGKDLADRLEGDGVRRRVAIAHLEALIRGLQAISANNPEIDQAVEDLVEIVDQEHADDRQSLLTQIATVLGPEENRGLRSAHYVQTHSPTVPSPEPRWYDRVGPLRFLRAAYDHLRGSPSGGTKPSVDEGREHLPGHRGQSGAQPDPPRP
jgi:hypothetical protein